MQVSAADMCEEAVALLAKKRGFKGTEEVTFSSEAMVDAKVTWIPAVASDVRRATR